MNLDKLIYLGNKHKDDFMDLAKAITDIEVTETDDETRDYVTRFAARDMAIGAAEMRKYHIGYGIVLGLGTAGAVSVSKKVYNKYKKKNELDKRLKALKQMVNPNL